MKVEDIDFDEFKAELGQCGNKVGVAYYNLYGEDLSIEDITELSRVCSEVYNEPMYTAWLESRGLPRNV